MLGLDGGTECVRLGLLHPEPELLTLLVSSRWYAHFDFLTFLAEPPDETKAGATGETGCLLGRDGFRSDAGYVDAISKGQLDAGNSGTIGLFRNTKSWRLWNPMSSQEFTWLITGRC